MLAKKTIAILISALAVTSLSGCLNPIQGAQYEAALSDLKANPLEDFKQSAYSKPTCGIDYCEPNPGYTFAKNGAPDTWPVFCQKQITWLKKMGADSWLAGEEAIAMPLEGHEDSAQVACVAGNTSFLGTTDGIRWHVVAGPTAYDIRTVMSREGQGPEDERFLPHTWDEAKKLLMDGARNTMNILSAIASYRLDHPTEDPSSTKTIKAALKDLDIDPGIKIIKDNEGKAHYLDIPADDVFLEFCLNISPFDPEYFGTPSPRDGFLSIWQPTESATVNQFGYSVSGACPKQ